MPIKFTIDLRMFSEDNDIAIQRFEQFNKLENDDKCLDDITTDSVGLSDTEARIAIVHIISEIEIAQVKSLPKIRRDELLRKVKA